MIFKFKSLTLQSVEEQLAHAYTSIRPELKRRVLLHGTFYAGLGAALIVGGGILIPTAVMSYIGLPLLFVGGGLILYGLTPYRELTQLTARPDQLIVTGDRFLHYIKEGAPYLSVPLSAVDRLSYCDEEPERYGIVVDLIEGGMDQVVAHQKGLQFRRYLNSARRRYHCDLFFPYFSPKSYRDITAGSQP